MSLIAEEGQELRGVIKRKGYYCQYCMNDDQQLFHHHFHHRFGKEVVYCRACIRMTYSSTETYYNLVEIKNLPEQADYQLDFELTAQQQFASREIVEVVKTGGRRLVHAVTGAGKTEMILEGIRTARQEGLNVAIVSPRVDVVKEVALRMKDYFSCDIDVLYQGETILYDSRFVISTVQQLVKYHHHFGLVIVDEVDAFPLPMDKRLQQLIKRAATLHSALIYLTATPPARLKKEMREETLVLPARYHRRPLPVPTYQYMSRQQMRKGKMKRYFERDAGSFLLVFFNDIKEMEEAAEIYKEYKPVTVYAADVSRHDKVAAIRSGAYPVIFTTTILERGFTMASLDVFVVDAGNYSAECLVQMAGRVDRKSVPYKGQVIFFHEGVTRSMMQAVKEIKEMNRLARMKGWLD
ncbi:DEAD/DEAH box helicase family protein [Macrococcus carouselicus]|uniref:DEAD/DEAH box helicase n=1 Tax=Macrococcus carouselicus TaxID=69969 RepID=A0A9Q8CMU1_9STAP|nr:DEAD/DEAH box helicase family protein [Macrococcus carouselicus]TDM03675.1 DEAD/DEAH box helicase [Macrococcus carouselicus]